MFTQATVVFLALLEQAAFHCPRGSKIKHQIVNCLGPASLDTAESGAVHSHGLKFVLYAQAGVEFNLKFSLVEATS